MTDAFINVVISYIYCLVSGTDFDDSNLTVHNFFTLCSVPLYDEVRRDTFYKCKNLITILYIHCV